MVASDYQVLYVNGDIPTTPLRLGQLIVDNGTLKICTSLSPLTYSAVGGGGGIQAIKGTFTNGSSAIVAPVNDIFVLVPTAGNITKVTLLTIGGSGNCVVDVRKKAYASYPPAGADSICAGAKPTIAAGIKYQDTALTGWTKAVSAGDVIGFSLVSTSTFTTIIIILEIT